MRKNKPDLKDLQQKIGYYFNNIDKLIKSLTHKSYAHENNLENNERLEFLGDAVLQFIISEYLMDKYPDLSEGMMSKFRAVLVSEVGLSRIARELTLGDYLLIGKGEEITKGREKESILADTLEAVLAAIYMDSREEFGTNKVMSIIHQQFHHEIIKAEKNFADIDRKTEIQEFVQKKKLQGLKYRLLEESGPDHNKLFITALEIENEIFGTGKGKSKKISEQNAAIEAFKKIKEKYES